MQVYNSDLDYDSGTELCNNIVSFIPRKQLPEA